MRSVVSHISHLRLTGTAYPACWSPCGKGIRIITPPGIETAGALVGHQPFTGWKASGVRGKWAGGPYYLLQFMQ